MNLGKTLFAQLMEYVPWKNFGRIIDRHKSDAGERTLVCADLDLSHLYRKPIVRPLLKPEIKLISSYYGVMVAFTATHTKKQVSPFVVALCEGAEAGFDVKSNRLFFGRIPLHKQILVNAWIEIHKEELIAG